jgi:DNA mismatch repair protein MutS
MSAAAPTPAMRQYHRFKEKYPGHVLLFRMGDFYEMFEDDAVTVSKALGLTLTERTAGVPMAGVPYHQLEVYAARLIKQGFRVAIAEQTQIASEAKGVVERAVTRVLTPGTLVDDGLLSEDASGALGAIWPGTPSLRGGGRASRALAGAQGNSGPPRREGLPMATLDCSTGEVIVLDCAPEALADEIARRGVTELLVPDDVDMTGPFGASLDAALERVRCARAARPAWHFRAAEAMEAIRRQYGVAGVEGFDLAPDDPAIPALGAALRYLRETQGAADEDAPKDRSALGPAPTLAHVRPPRREAAGDRLILDAVSLRALEVERTIRAGSVEGSLLGEMLGSGRSAGCRTAMGRRLVADWLRRPLADLGAIRSRHRRVAALVEDERTARALAGALADVQDVARIAGRIAVSRALPRDVVGLGASLGKLEGIREVVEGAPAFAGSVRALRAVAPALAPLGEKICSMCEQQPPAKLSAGGLIKDGVDAELDECRSLQRDAGSWLAKYQGELIERLGIAQLRVGFNKVFGYYIELSAAQARAAEAKLRDAAMTRKQTLKNAERYITPELKEFEEKVTHAEERALGRERALFEGLCAEAARLCGPIAAFADVVAELDALSCFAQRARQRGWVEPEMTGARVLRITGGRHPTLERTLGEGFVPNDVELGSGGGRAANGRGGDERGGLEDDDASAGDRAGEPAGSAGQRLALITGPNMAGKSTYIRTAALLTLLAHAGSFVPADSATIGLTDRIFTRVGADDALHAGQSTFMVEMTETAAILNSATDRSLVILDEIGRGTSTLDGLSLAWAVVEFLAGELPAAAPAAAAGMEADAVDDPESEAHAAALHPHEPEAPAGSPAAGAPSANGKKRTAAKRPQPARPRTLFATHYHELTDLEDRLPKRVRNLHVAVREWGEEIVFLHRILPGRTDQSYGVHVARLAGVPAPVVARAKQVLASLDVSHHGEAPAGGARAREPEPLDQLPLFGMGSHPAVGELRELKIESLTPLAAFDILRKLHEMAGQQ